MGVYTNKAVTTNRLISSAMRGDVFMLFLQGKKRQKTKETEIGVNTIYCGYYCCIFVNTTKCIQKPLTPFVGTGTMFGVFTVASDCAIHRHRKGPGCTWKINETVPLPACCSPQIYPVINRLVSNLFSFALKTNQMKRGRQNEQRKSADRRV